jgi:hypothetical protein
VLAADAISIIVYSVGNSDEPYYLVERNGAWQDFRCGTPAKKLEKLRADYDKLLDRAALVVSNNLANSGVPPTPVFSMLDGMCASLYEQMLPEALRKLLQDKVSPGNQPPVVRLHIQTSFDWVPWELMRGPGGYLGLQYQISRVPIALTLPSLDETKPKDVRRIRSLLGKSVLDGQLLADWKTTFAPPATVQYHLLPNGAGIYPSQDDVLTAMADDILHLTCHGAVDDDATFGDKYYWALDPTNGVGFLGGISEQNFVNLALTDGRPLIFANACAQMGKAGGVVTGFGRELFVRGAQNVVSAFAKVSKSAAVPFATSFYRHLLIDGKTIGEALLNTKLEFKAADAQDPSYLFYCLYGPPGTRFKYV